MRTFIHVHDIARSFVHAIENHEKMSNNVFNVGDDSMNRSKRAICELIQGKVDYYLHLADYGKDADARNYIVSYDKISETGFNTTVSIEKGVDELVKALQVVQLNDPYRNV